MATVWFVPRPDDLPCYRVGTIKTVSLPAGRVRTYVRVDGGMSDNLGPALGGYGYSMASNYNEVCRPPVVCVDDGRYRVVTRRETYEDLVRLDTER